MSDLNCTATLQSLSFIIYCYFDAKEIPCGMFKGKILHLSPLICKGDGYMAVLVEGGYTG